jgi:hypothetical protein
MGISQVRIERFDTGAYGSLLKLLADIVRHTGSFGQQPHGSAYARRQPRV